MFPLLSPFFFAISWFLATYVFSSQPLPFRFFAFSGIAIGILLTTINAWRLRQLMAELLGKR
jgi:hypothetical protein